MKVTDLHIAIIVLREAGRELRTGYSRSIREEMRLGDECYRAAALLREIIDKECPELKIEREPALVLTDNDVRKADGA